MLHYQLPLTSTSDWLLSDCVCSDVCSYCRREFLVPCRSSRACLFPDDVLQDANICFSSLLFPEWEGLRGMPTSTNVSEPETHTNTHTHRRNGVFLSSSPHIERFSWVVWDCTPAALSIRESNMPFSITASKEERDWIDFASSESKNTQAKWM